ncbi:MAG: hypothetical protein PHI48_09145 [Bacteroidales bacterium]|nr:hypothetical protein [Bacteroidales bacterium]
MKTEFVLLFLMLPILFQCIVGTLAVKKKVKLSLGLVGLINLLSTLLILFLVFKYIDYGAQQVQNHDGLWVVGLFALTGFGVLLSLIIFLVQWLVKRFHKPTEAKE